MAILLVLGIRMLKQFGIEDLGIKRFVRGSNSQKGVTVTKPVVSGVSEHSLNSSGILNQDFSVAILRWRLCL